MVQRKEISSLFASYIALALMAFGVCLMAKSGYGLPIFAYPAFALASRLFEESVFLNLGVVETAFQLVFFTFILIACRAEKNKMRQLVLCVSYGAFLELARLALGHGNYKNLHTAILASICGILLFTLAIAIFYTARVSVNMQDFFVTALCNRFSFRRNVAKYIFSSIYFLFGALLGLMFHGDFTGIGVASLVSLLLTPSLVSLFGTVIDKLYVIVPTSKN